MPLPIPAPASSGMTATTPVPLYWARYGPREAPSLLVLHGGPGAHHDYLLPQFLRLSDRWDTVFYDQRGGGRSRGTDTAPVGWRDHAADVALVATELGCRPLTLVGYSWGALLALLYALEARAGHLDPVPERLVLVDPAPLSLAWRREFEAEFQRRQQSDRVQALRQELADSGLRERDPEAHRQRSFELSVAGYFDDPRRAADLTPFRVTARVQQSVWESLGDFDLLPRLGALDLPTLLVHGWRDPIPVDSTLAAARAMQARCVVLEACGHVPHVEQPDALFTAIGQFLEESVTSRG